MGPACIAARNVCGMSASRLLSRADDSVAKSLSLASVGDSRLACKAETARWFRLNDCMKKVLEYASDYHGCLAGKEQSI
jgi:hypothetical protein